VKSEWFTKYPVISPFGHKIHAVL